MAVIEREREIRSGSRVMENRKKVKEDFTNEKIESYAHELLEYMGTINWDQEGMELEDISDSNPFKPVFDAMAIIKGDVDDLFRTQKQIEEKLTREEEKYCNIFQNISDFRPLNWFLTLPIVFLYEFLHKYLQLFCGTILANVQFFYCLDTPFIFKQLS